MFGIRWYFHTILYCVVGPNSPTLRLLASISNPDLQDLLMAPWLLPVPSLLHKNCDQDPPTLSSSSLHSTLTKV
ncbi:hypothetical protein QCA50_008276 [Cerrena zonata]|uniref:Uncharacterized protein n=1 Tax=Cerrena zonata TaxID=2478898 RepID=A0AAW0GFN3_9APHY